MAEQTEQIQEMEQTTKATCVMICVDRSENAENAFNFYLERIHHPDNKVLITHVAEMIPLADHVHSRGKDIGLPSTVGPSPAIAEELMLKERKKAEEIKQKYTEQCEEKGIKFQILSLFDEGKGIGPTICDQAKKNNVDIIVCGSRGLGVIRRTFLGSISDYILHHSHLPTIIYPKRAPVDVSEATYYHPL